MSSLRCVLSAKVIQHLTHKSWKKLKDLAQVQYMMAWHVQNLLCKQNGCLQVRTISVPWEPSMPRHDMFMPTELSSQTTPTFSVKQSPSQSKRTWTRTIGTPSLSPSWRSITTTSTTFWTTRQPTPSSQSKSRALHYIIKCGRCH